MSKANVASASAGHVQNVSFSRRSFVFCAVVALVFTGLAFGYGYFFGRYEQIALNKSVLKPIADVNCGAGKSL